MSGTKQQARTRPATVNVEVVVNHDDLRRGERGEVELTDHVRARLDKGYLRIIFGDLDDGEPVTPLGGTAVRVAPGGVLLGVDGAPGSVAVVRGEGSNDQGGQVPTQS